jgi:protein ImuB
MFCCLCSDAPAEALRALAFDFSPLVEQSAANAFTFDATGLERLFGLPQEIAAAIARRAAEIGIKARIAIASNADTAICVARSFPGVNIVPYGDEARFMEDLPVAALAPSLELADTLARWGIRQLREFGALPANGLAARLGPECVKLRRLARGEVERKLRLIEDPLRFEEELELEHPVELLEPLLFLLARLLNGLLTRLATRALSTNELRLRLRLENRAMHERTLRLPVATLDAKALLKLLQLDLEAHSPASPVLHLWMAANPVEPRAAQGGLFTPESPEPVKLELTLARIRALVGDDRAGAVQLLDTHRPDAFRAAPLELSPVKRQPSRIARPSTAASLGVSLSLRMFRPPRAARVAIAASHPTFVAAERIRGNVLESAGPWRISGDWWTTEDWSRDEWDISLSDGGIYRIYCCPGGWFVEGSYD